tara:strand:+ start:3058 stop:3180 length:123 start_codon:yes stop_codon:yes gene_type:complete
MIELLSIATFVVVVTGLLIWAEWRHKQKNKRMWNGRGEHG